GPFGLHRNMKSKLSKPAKIFGFVYFLLNSMFFTVICITAVYAVIKSSQCSPGWISLVFPTAGILSGYWIRHGWYNWWRNVVIVLSLLFTAVFIFIAIFISPKL
ncbi:MAG: hypothetical protein KAS66_14660, partial [Candidatus Omnitrophica bacterium]|nr:hypothetical protein [Candidatus Omnitrophota bacterium]